MQTGMLVKHACRIGPVWGRPLSMQVAPAVAEAVQSGGPVVALESTIITHGMPYPQNLETALMVEDVIRKEGAVPATVGIIGGRLHVGLSPEQIERLASHRHPCVKTSRRDLAAVMAKGLDGGTTVSGTLAVAARAGLDLMVTGGVGGVHRGGELSMDVSADVTELGRAAVACVCAGVKSILDVGRTLEALETQGVSVVTLGDTDEFPAFFTPDSGHRSPHHVTSCAEAAELLYQHRQLKLESGVLLAVPIPEEHRAHGETVQQAIERAVSEAERRGVQGRDVTPFVLSRVNELTGGASLAANVRLVENNARHGATIAVQLAALSRQRSEKCEPPGRVFNIPADVTAEGAAPDADSHRGSDAGTDRGQPSETGAPCVIGGSNVDFVVQVTENEIRRDATTHRGRIAQGYGGVGRNVADALSRLGHRPRFISAVGRDRLGDALLAANPHMDWTCVLRPEQTATASYMLLVDAAGAVEIGVGDMDAHRSITPQLLERHAALLSESPLVVVDANTPGPALARAAALCAGAAVPLWFEPTDPLKAAAVRHLLQLPRPPLVYTSPNVAELRAMADALCEVPPGDPGSLRGEALLQWCRDASLQLLQHFYCLVVTMGTSGVLVTRRGLHSDQLLVAPLPAADEPGMERQPSDSCCLHYSVTPAAAVVNESGAGDCFNAGFVSGVLAGLDQDRCVWRGLEAARQAVADASAVPASLQLPAAGLTPRAEGRQLL